MKNQPVDLQRIPTDRIDEKIQITHRTNSQNKEQDDNRNNNKENYNKDSNRRQNRQNQQQRE